MSVQNSNLFYMQATSAESNVLNLASSLGRECLILTKFVKGSPMADFIRRQLRARNIAFEGAKVDQGGPWGIVISSISRIPASVSGRPGSGTTEQAKLAAPFPSTSSMWSASSARKA